MKRLLEIERVRKPSKSASAIVYLALISVSDLSRKGFRVGEGVRGKASIGESPVGGPARDMEEDENMPLGTKRDQESVRQNINE